MKRTTVTCPVCGTVNRDLFLEETEGWFECQECMCSSQVLKETDNAGDGSIKWTFSSVVARRAV